MKFKFEMKKKIQLFVSFNKPLFSNILRKRKTLEIRYLDIQMKEIYIRVRN